MAFAHRMSIFLIVTISLASGGCSNELTEGTYRGTFTVVYDTATLTGMTTLHLSEGRYECDGNDNRIPAGGSGTYRTENGIILFQEERMWTADFDWNLILKGGYNYSVSGKRLKLSMRTDRGAFYKYDLLKN